MKTLSLCFLLLAVACLRLPGAESAGDTNQPASGAVTNDAVRQMLDRLYRQLQTTNAPAANQSNTTNAAPTPREAKEEPAEPVSQEEPGQEAAPEGEQGSPLTTTPGPPDPDVATTPGAAAAEEAPSVEEAPAPPAINRTGSQEPTPEATEPSTNAPAVTSPPALPPRVQQPGTVQTNAVPAVRPPGTLPGARPPGRPGTPPPGLPGARPPALPGTTPPGATNAAAAGPGASPDDVFPPGLIVFQEADLAQVLDIYQELTGRTVLRPANLPQATITIRTQTELTRTEAVNALDSILSLNGITMLPQGEKFVKAVPTTQAGQEARAFNTDPVNELPEAGAFVVQIVKLKNTAPSDVAQALQPFAKNPQAILAIDDSGIVILRDNAENVKRMMEVLEQIDVVPVQEFESIVIPIKYALAGDIAQVLSSLTEGGSATTVGSSGTGGTLGGGVGAGFGARGTGNLGGAGVGGFGGASSYNRRGGYGSSVRPRALNTGSTGSRSSFQERLRGIVSRAAQGSGGGEFTVLGETQIIADERTNSLLIFAAKKDIPTIRDIVEKLDVVLPQVLIEAIIMEVTLDDSFNFGVSWLQRPRQVGDFQYGGVSIGQDTQLTEDPTAVTNLLNNISGLRYFGKFDDDFDVALRASASDSRVDILSRPRIQTSHAVEANLFIGETRPFITGTYFGGTGFGSTSQYQQLQIGITLSVLPLVNVDGLVVMDISQRIQNVSGNVVIDGNEVPITADKEATAKVAVLDQETIMLGGFISNDVRNNDSGVPFLKDIPLLGFFFRGTSKQNARRELVVLIRPTVLPTPQEAAIVATEEKAKLPGIIAAEAKYGADEKQRLKQAEREVEKREEKIQKELLRQEGFYP